MPLRTTPEQASDLGTAPVGRLLLHACTQTTMSVGIYGIYALTNAWFVARGVGDTALAAVNLVAPLLLLSGAASTTVGVGGASLVARALGAGDTRRAASAAGNAFAIFWAVALAGMVAGLVFLEPLLTLLGAHGPERAFAREYAIILLAGSLVSTGFSAIVRAEGRLRFSTALWVVPVLVQITLDPLLIFGLDMGVRGAALGTVGGQAVSAAMSMWFFFINKNRAYPVRFADLKPRFTTIGQVVSIGAPSFLAGLGATVLLLLINQRLSALGGLAATAALASFAIASRIQTFAVMPQTGITQGFAPIVSYNVGMGAHDRVRRTRTLALTSTVVYGVAVAAVIAGAAGPITRAFTSDPEIIATATTALRIIAVSFAVSGIAPLVSGYFQAVGRPRHSYLISVGTLVAIKIPLVLALGGLSLTWLWWAIPLGEAVSAAIAFAVYRRAGRATV